MAVAAARTHPALGADHDGDGLVEHLNFKHDFFIGLNQRAARVGKLLGIGFYFLDHQAAQRRRAAQDFFQPALLFAQGFQLLLNLDGFEPRQLAQSNFQNVLGLPVAELEALDQRGLGLVGLADDGNHFIDIEQHQVPPLQDVNAVQHLVEPMLRTLFNRRLAKRKPLRQHLPQGFLRRLAVQPHHGQVDRRRTLQAGVGQQGVDEFLLADLAGLGLKHQAHGGVFAGLIAHHVKHRQHGLLELHLVQAERLFSGLDLGIGDLFNLFEHALGADAGRQLLHHQLPLAARQVFNLPARAHLERAPAGAVGRCNFCSV